MQWAGSPELQGLSQCEYFEVCCLFGCSQGTVWWESPAFHMPSFLFLNNWKILFIFGRAVAAGLFSSYGEWGLLSSCSAQASHHSGFSPQWLLLLQSAGSGVPGLQWLQHVGSIVVAHRLGCSVACEIFPDQGPNPSCIGRWILYHWGKNPPSFLKDALAGAGLSVSLLATSCRIHRSVVLLTPQHVDLRQSGYQVWVVGKANSTGSGCEWIRHYRLPVGWLAGAPSIILRPFLAVCSQGRVGYPLWGCMHIFSANRLRREPSPWDLSVVVQLLGCIWLFWPHGP